MKINFRNIELSIFKYLWVLILMPKEVQFGLFVLLLLYLIVKRDLKLNSLVKLIFFYVIIQFCAIFKQLIIGHPDGSRIFAAFNTASILGIAAMFYSFYASKRDISKKYLDLMAKYISINFIVLFCVWIFSLVVNKNDISIGGLVYHLRRNDYLSTGTTTRFCGLMDTLLCPSHFYIIQWPILYFNSFINKKNTVNTIIVGLIGLIPVIDTHSRAGLMICIILYFVGSFSLIKNRSHNKRFIQGIYILFGLLLFLSLMIIFPEIERFIRELANLRTSSNNTRFNIYYNSIKLAWNNSPFIGMGIKYMIGKYPLGSHSTYIGVFYKTGIIGSVIFILAFSILYFKLHISLKKSSCGMVVFLMLLCYLLFLMFADLDATDWIVVSFFSICGLLQNTSLYSE